MPAVPSFPHYSLPGQAPTCPSCGESVRAGATSCGFCFATFPPQPGQRQPAASALPAPSWGVGRKLLCALALVLGGLVWATAVFTLGVAGFSYVTAKNPHFAHKLKTRATIWQCRRAQIDPRSGLHHVEIKLLCDYMETSYRKRYGSAP